MGCGPTEVPKEIEAIDVSSGNTILDFTLLDHGGKQRRLSDFRGKIVALFFGYTMCPDVCPTTLSEFVEVYRLLGSEADGVQVLFITVDPERDTQRLLSEYIPAFHPRFIGLYSTPEETRKVAEAFGVTFERVKSRSDSTYIIDHTAYVFLIDAAGRLRLKVPYAQPADSLVKLIREIRE